MAGRGWRTDGAVAVCAFLTVSLATTAPQIGCSMFFAKGPPEHPALGEEIRCTGSSALPVVDTLLAGTQMIRTLYALSLTDADYPPNAPINRDADIALGISFLAIASLSAGIGYSRVSECNEARGNFPRKTTTPSRNRTMRGYPALPGPAAPRTLPPSTAPETQVPSEEPVSVPTPIDGGAAPDGGTPAESPTLAAPPPLPPVPQQMDDEDPRTKPVRGRGPRTGRP